MTGPKRALITGIHGFTGRYMAAELRAGGYEVFGTGTTPGGADAHYDRVDLGDASGLKRLLARLQPDVVVHLAGRAFVGDGSADAFHRVNVLGTRHLLEAIACTGKVPDCILISSSANVYGNAACLLLSEDTPPQPANDYAVSKLAMEAMVEGWQQQLPIVIARPFNYTGVGQAQTFLLPKIVAHFRQRAPRIELGNLDVWRDFSDVRAVVRAYRGLLEARPLGETVNVCSGVMHSLREIVEVCSGVTGHHLQVEVNPQLVRGNEVRELRGDNAKLLTLVPGWQTPPITQTLGWMLAEG
jgi:nucleoside-diphosphate-sugar epimerase